jgi:CheY-specific phosphatase CheX
MDDTILLRSLDRAMREALFEMLPGVPFEPQEDAAPSNRIADAAMVALSGHLCGSLIVLTPRESTLLLARRIAGDLLREDDRQMAENEFLTQLEQDSVRELSNRIGCIFAGAVTADGRRLAPTFPIFVCGHDISVVAESDYRLRSAFVVDSTIQVDARVFLSVPKPSSSREERIRELERMREELLAGETK